MYKFLLQPKWLAITALCILLLPGFKALSDWQWHRLETRQAYNTTIQANVAETPVALTELVTIDGNGYSTLPNSVWRPVQVTGTWDTENEVLVRKKSMESDAGFWVVTPFTSVDGFVIMVNRGWIAAGDSAVESPIVPSAPTGQVNIAGRIREVVARSKPQPTDLPPGQVDTLIPIEIVPNGNAVTDIYLEMTASEPASRSEEIREMPAPEVTEGPHRSYALQWIFFAIMTVIGWLVLVRNEISVLKQIESNTEPKVG